MSEGQQHLIYLTGFMGSGKSTIAPILANTLGYSCFDIDSEIQHLAGKQVSEIFSELGEEYFRSLEHALLLEVSAREACVISLGGGTIANGNNLQVVKSSGILIYLKIAPEFIFHRLKHKTDRPMLKSGDGTLLGEAELRSRIDALLTQREPFYAQADLTVTTDNRNIGRTVDEIVRGVQLLERK